MYVFNLETLNFAGSAQFLKVLHLIVCENYVVNILKRDHNPRDYIAKWYIESSKIYTMK